MAAPFAVNLKFTCIVFSLLFLLSISFLVVFKLIKNDIQSGAVGALGFNQSLGRATNNSRMLTELLIMGDKTDHNVYQNSLPYVILACKNCSCASGRIAVRELDDLAEKDRK